MKKTGKTLGDAELEIMQVIWASTEPVTSGFILGSLPTHRKWPLSTLMTSLSRLVEKGFLSCDKSSGTNLYAAIYAENDYKAQESKNFLEKLYGNSVQSLITTLYSNQVIKDSDVEELRKYLDELEGEK